MLDETHDDDARLWASLDRSTSGRFTAYRSQTSRPIHLVALEPTRTLPAAPTADRR